MRSEVCIASRGELLHGILNLPDNMSDDGRYPALILCHGFTGHCEEEIFNRIAEESCRSGFAVLRFDFAGSGKSTGSFVECTSLNGWREDILAAAEWLSGREGIDRNQLTLLGHSMGGAAALAASESGEFCAIVGWAPAVDVRAVFRRILGVEAYDGLLRQPAGQYTSAYDGAEYTINGQFLREFEEADIPEAVINSGRTRVLLLTGDADAVVDTGPAEDLSRRIPDRVTSVTLHGEDHSMMRRHTTVVMQTIGFLRDI
ncbi:MAG: alpha/beta fold hydrolase [Clostridium sp.]|nr:alpha/beta fold hydrolase [Clostridium sp.]MBP3215752.1 alpha/beta fold hydrolase [Clostridium sp.]